MPRYILTGAPGSGKTAVLRLLESRGHIVVEEAATDVIALEQALGHQEPWEDPAFIDQVVSLQRQWQLGSTAHDAAIFFDRSPVCTLALSSYLGHATSPLLAAEVERVVRDAVYQPTVFLIRNQGFVQPTAARRISLRDSLAFEELHEQTYERLGFRLENVPAGPVPDRVGHILRHVHRPRRVR